MGSPELPPSVDAALGQLLDEKETLPINPIGTSEYIVQIDKYMEFFGKDRMLVLLHEDLSKHPRETMAAVCEFLGVDVGASIDFDRQVNVTEDFQRSLVLERLAARSSTIPGYRLARRLLPRPIKELTMRIALRTTANQTVIEPMSKARRLELADHFKPYNARLADYMGRDLSAWNR